MKPRDIETERQWARLEKSLRQWARLEKSLSKTGEGSGDTKGGGMKPKKKTEPKKIADLIMTFDGGGCVRFHLDPAKIEYVHQFKFHTSLDSVSVCPPAAESFFTNLPLENSEKQWHVELRLIDEVK